MILAQYTGCPKHDFLIYIDHRPWQPWIHIRFLLSNNLEGHTLKSQGHSKTYLSLLGKLFTSQFLDQSESCIYSLNQLELAGIQRDIKMDRYVLPWSSYRKYEIRIIKIFPMQFAKMIAVVTMVAGGAGILANCLNIFVLSRWKMKILPFYILVPNNKCFNNVKYIYIQQQH